MWIADLVSAAAVALILFADTDRIWPIYLAILVENVATMVFRPAARALTPRSRRHRPRTGRRERPERLHRQRDPARRTTARRAAAGRSGNRVRARGRHRQLSVVSGNHRDRPHPPARRSDRETSRPLEGFRYVVRHRALRGVLIGQTIFLTANAGLTALLVPFTVDRLHAPGYVVGYLISGLGAGYLIGAALSTRAATWLGIRDLLALTQFATAAAFFALFNAPNVPVAIVAAALIGLPGSILLITAETTIQRTAPAAMLGRIGALFFAADSLALLIGALAAPAVTLALDLPLTLNLLAAFAVLAAPVTLIAVPGHPAAFTRTSAGV